jgi:hypothetical protein
VRIMVYVAAYLLRITMIFVSASGVELCLKRVILSQT